MEQSDMDKEASLGGPEEQNTELNRAAAPMQRKLSCMALSICGSSAVQFLMGFKPIYLVSMVTYNARAIQLLPVPGADNWKKHLHPQQLFLSRQLMTIVTSGITG
jgi:hypothetical protein